MCGVMLVAKNERRLEYWFEWAVAFSTADPSSQNILLHACQCSLLSNKSIF